MLALKQTIKDISKAIKYSEIHFLLMNLQS